MEKGTKLPKRTWISIVVIFLLIPALVFFGGRLGGRTYYLVGTAVIFLTIVPFFLVFEQHRPQAREVAVIAVLCALAVAARAAFAAVPSFKPMMAIIMIAGMAYGPEAGFLVGAMGAFVSNFLFGQGPWTPWQMFAYGLSGFLAGGAVRLRLLQKKKTPYGGVRLLRGGADRGTNLRHLQRIHHAHPGKPDHCGSHLSGGVPL